MTSRRQFLLAATGAAGYACARGRADARLKSRPSATAPPASPGLRGLELRKTRDAQLYVPASVPNAAPLLVYLHGAGGSEQQGIKRLREFADTFRFILLSPASESRTWDAIRGSYSTDARNLDQALERTFATCRVDPQRIGLCGFSDGASYALGLGLSNGDLFRAVMAFSPGFIPTPFQPSPIKPRVFVSHGTQDEILPIDSCSRRMVPELQRDGYRVTFREFDGPHTMPHEISEEAVKWFLTSPIAAP